MRVTHRLVGYDRQTDRVKFLIDMPGSLMRDAKIIAQVPQDDPDAAWSYPLSNAQTRSLMDLIGAAVAPDEAYFYLEAFADSVPTEKGCMGGVMALETEIAAFERQREQLEKHHKGKFVVFRGEEMIGAFDTFHNAAREAVAKFGRGPYLIRQVGVAPPAMPRAANLQLADGD